MQLVRFVNATDEDFTRKWDGQEMTIPAGESMMMEWGMAYSFARRLAIRECNKKSRGASLPTRSNLDPYMKKFINKNEAKTFKSRSIGATYMHNADKEDTAAPAEKPTADPADEDDSFDEDPNDTPQTPNENEHSGQTADNGGETKPSGAESAGGEQSTPKPGRPRGQGYAKAKAPSRARKTTGTPRTPRGV